MRTYKLLVNVLLATVLSLSVNTLVLAQKAVLPENLTEQSSLEEVLNWLDKTSFQEARIGLESNVSEPEPGEIPTTATRYYEWAFFSKGFKLAKINGCNIVLRNDDVDLIRFETKYPNPAEGSLDDFRKNKTNRSQFTGDFFIPLQELKANKAPYQYTKKAEKAALLGTWRTEFKLKSDFVLFPRFPSRDEIKEAMKNGMRIETKSAKQNGEIDKMYGDELTFTFDDKQMSENFYAAFSRSITLCKGK